MPWHVQDAIKKDKKADTAAKKKQWTAVANSVMKKTGDDAKAIKIANGVIKKSKKK
jgi:hypothetical protein